MQKPAFLTQGRISRFVLAVLLMLGILLPLLMLFDLGRQIPIALLYAVGVMVLLTVLTIPRLKWFALGALLLLAGIQFVLPGMGFWGGSVEALKAIVLYFNGLTIAMPAFATETAALLAVGVAIGAFLFSQKVAGFLPAAILVVLMLFSLWTLGRSDLIWYTLPSLVAMLLLVSQSAHKKISLLNVLPMALIVVVLALLLLPAGRVTIPPMEEAAFQLRQTIADYLFFTEPRRVFTLGNYGYYPMGGGQLGGPAEPSDAPVMMVKTDRKTLMRAVSKDEYTGRSFRDTTSNKRHLYVNPRWATLREKVFLEKMPAEGIRKASTLLDVKAISVQMQNTATSSIFTPIFLRDQNMGSNMVPYFVVAGEIFITRDLEMGDFYTVFAPVFEGGDGALSALVNAAPKDDANYAEIYAQYTGLPEHMEQAVFDDVASMTANAQGPYEKALAIMRHLQRYYRYTLTPENPPENQDFVTYFLKVGKEGYCTYYASAMTVLCRMVGLPARYVEGFVANPAGDGYAYVTGKDAHAWTEVYFEGFGWVPFDPTPPQNQNQQQDSEDPPPVDNPEDEPEDETEDENPPETPPPDDPDMPPMENEPDSDTPDEPEDEPEDDPQQDEEKQNLWWLLAVLAAIGGVMLRMHLRMPSRVAAKKETEQDKVFVYGSAVATLLRLRGRTPKPGETPLLFAKRMDGVHILPVPILPLWRMMALSNYSARQPGKEQTARAKEIFDKSYKAQPLFVKLRFMLLAAFSKRCYTALDTHIVQEAPASKTVLPDSITGKGGKKGGAKNTTGNAKGKKSQKGQSPQKGKTSRRKKAKAKRSSSKARTERAEGKRVKAQGAGKKKNRHNVQSNHNSNASRKRKK